MTIFRQGIRMNCIAPGPIETEVDRDLEEKNFFFCLSGGFWQTWPHWRSCQDNDGSDSRGLVLEFVKREWHCPWSGKTRRDRGDRQPGHISLLWLCQVTQYKSVWTLLTRCAYSWINAETVTLDGGEFRMLAGEFNKLRKVLTLTCWIVDLPSRWHLNNGTWWRPWSDQPTRNPNQSCNMFVFQEKAKSFVTCVSCNCKFLVLGQNIMIERWNPAWFKRFKIIR